MNDKEFGHGPAEVGRADFPMNSKLPPILILALIDAEAQVERHAVEHSTIPQDTETVAQC